VLEWALRSCKPCYDPRRQIVFRSEPEFDTVLGPRNETVRQRTPKGDYDLQVTFNRHGLRDPKDFAVSTADDLFVLGDSFALGWGVQEDRRFSDLLASALKRRVFNIAIPNDLAGYDGLLRYVRSRGAVVSNLIVAVCMYNDLKNYNLAGRPQLSKVGDRLGFVARLRAFMQSHSALYLALSFQVQQFPALRRLCERSGVARDISALTPENVYDPAVIASSRDKLLEMARGFERDHFLVLIAPSLSLWLGDNQETEQRIHSEFVSSLVASGLRVVDMKPRFEAGGNPRAYYL